MDENLRQWMVDDDGNAVQTFEYRSRFPSEIRRKSIATKVSYIM